MVKVSIIAVINVEGARQQFKELIAVHNRHLLWSAIQYKIQQIRLIKLNDGMEVSSIQIITNRNELVAPSIAPNSTLNLAAYRPENTDQSVIPLLLLRVLTRPMTVGSLECVIQFNGKMLRAYDKI